MTWPFDPLQITPPDEPEQGPPRADGAPEQTLLDENGAEIRPDGKRTDVDDVLDAVAGKQRKVRVDRRTCPQCDSPMKRRSPGIGVGTITMRCTNRACRLEVPLASTRVRIDAPPPPPNPLLLGGPYRGNPDRGGGAPPIDPHEPVYRRVSELIRRIEDGD